LCAGWACLHGDMQCCGSSKLWRSSITNCTCACAPPPPAHMYTTCLAHTGTSACLKGTLFLRHKATHVGLLEHILDAVHALARHRCLPMVPQQLPIVLHILFLHAHVCLRVCACERVNVCVCARRRTHVCMCVCMPLCVCLRACMHVGVCMCARVHVYAHMRVVVRVQGCTEVVFLMH